MLYTIAKVAESFKLSMEVAVPRDGVNGTAFPPVTSEYCGAFNWYQRRRGKEGGRMSSEHQQTSMARKQRRRIANLCVRTRNNLAPKRACESVKYERKAVQKETSGEQEGKPHR